MKLVGIYPAVELNRIADTLKILLRYIQFRCDESVASSMTCASEVTRRDRTYKIEILG